MKIRRATALLAGGVVLAMTAAACGGSTAPPSTNTPKGPSGTATWAEVTDTIQNFFSVISAGNSTATANIVGRLQLSPFEILPDFTIKADPDLMAGEPATATTNGKFTVTYTLNPKAVWNDGQPITWQDFEFTWQIQKSSDPKKGGCEALLGTTGYDQIESVAKGANDQTAVVTFSSPYPDWKSLFQLYSKHVIDKGDPKATCAYITKGWPLTDGIPVGATNGPWQLLKTDIDTQNKTETLTPSPKWWGASQPGLQRLVYLYTGSDAGVAVKNLKSGTVDIIYPQPQLDLVKQIKALAPSVTSETNFGLSFEHMDLNTRNVHLAKPEIRKAIALGLDRQQIVTATVGQFDSRASVLGNRLIVTNQPGYKNNGAAYDHRDVAAAQRSIESAGYKKGPDGIYVSPQGQRLSLEMMTTVNNKLRENTIDTVTAQLKDVGIEIKKYLNPDIFAGKEKPKSLEAGGFDIGLFAWVGSPFVTQATSIYKSVKGDAQGQNYVHGNDPLVDSLFDQLNKETDPQKLTELQNQIDTQLWNDMYTIPLYQKPTFIAFNARLTPYDPGTRRGVGDNATQVGPLWNNDTFTFKSS